MKVLLILSCKGGVGKTTIATALAKALNERHDTGILDLDITNPCIRRVTGTMDRELEIADTVTPVSKDGLKVMSTSFILPNEDTAIMWKGERRRRMIYQFLKQVDWGDIEYLVVDMPPGTGDEPLAVVDFLGSVGGAVIVSTPQELSLMNVRKTITMCRKLGIPIVGLIENMSGFKCPNCKTIVDVFHSGSAEKMCLELEVPFLGRIPLNPKISVEGDQGRVGTLLIEKQFNDVIHKVLSFFGEELVTISLVTDDKLLAKLDREEED